MHSNKQNEGHNPCPAKTDLLDLIHLQKGATSLHPQTSMVFVQTSASVAWGLTLSRVEWLHVPPTPKLALSCGAALGHWSY